MFEQKIDELKEKRKQLNQLDSFDEITKVWQEIKKIHESCEVFLKNISSDLEKLESNEQTESAKDLKFNVAFERINQIVEKIATSDIEEIPALIKEMKSLKNFCLQKLEAQKVDMEEIKL